MFVDGLAGNSGSTAWCKDLKGAGSTDGTVEYLQGLQKMHKNLIVQTASQKWRSKDAMVNKAVDLIKEKTDRAMLWQIDADEQWTVEAMMHSEKELIDQKGLTGAFHANYYMGENLMAYGMWGEGIGYPYYRLWNWEGQYFLRHEPPVLLKGNGKIVLMPLRFNHYAYYFPQDVEFKSKYYGGHEKVYDNWKKLQSGRIRTPCALRYLFGHTKGIFPNTVIRAI